jgi:hypothetical protein
VGVEVLEDFDVLVREGVPEPGNFVADDFRGQSGHDSSPRVYRLAFSAEKLTMVTRLSGEVTGMVA